MRDCFVMILPTDQGMRGSNADSTELTGNGSRPGGARLRPAEGELP